MGWYYEFPSRADMVRELSKGAIVHRVVGSRLYTVRDYTDRDGQARRAIAVYLMAADSRNPPHCSHGYKPMDESMGPCFYDCPLAFLDIAQPAPTDAYAQEWRAKVRTQRAEQAAKRAQVRALAVGQTIDLVPGCKPPRVRIASVKPLRGYDDSGRLYRISPRHIATATEGAQSCLAI